MEEAVVDLVLVAMDRSKYIFSQALIFFLGDFILIFCLMERLGEVVGVLGALAWVGVVCLTAVICLTAVNPEPAMLHVVGVGIAIEVVGLAVFDRLLISIGVGGRSAGVTVLSINNTTSENLKISKIRLSSFWSSVFLPLTPLTP
jgi:hypothetical protein